MYIRSKPSSKATRPAPGMKTHTNLGEFSEGEVRGPFSEMQDVAEAKRLVANGEFVECGPDGVEFGAKPKKDEPKKDEPKDEPKK